MPSVRDDVSALVVGAVHATLIVPPPTVGVEPEVASPLVSAGAAATLIDAGPFTSMTAPVE